MTIVGFVQTNDAEPPVTVDTFVAAACEHLLGWMQASAGLMRTPEVKDARWLDVARMVGTMEELTARPLPDARAVLDRVRADAWCQLTVGWKDVPR